MFVRNFISLASRNCSCDCDCLVNYLNQYDANIHFRYFKFNNSALFASNRGVGSDQKQGTADPFSNNLDDPADSGSSDAVFNQLFWNMGTSSFQCFLEYLDNRVDPVTLSLTKEVMAKRESLQVYIVGLQGNVKKGLLALDQIRQEMQVNFFEKKLKK